MTMWMVRAERHGVLFDAFLNHQAVAIGWPDVGSIAEIDDWDLLREKVRETYPGNNHSVGRTSGMLWRIYGEIAANDWILTYDPSSRTYRVGHITSEYVYDPSLFDEDHHQSYPHIRKVNWDPQEISRDDLKVGTRNSLGSLFTLFALNADAEADVLATLSGERPVALPEEDVDDTQSIESLAEDVEARSLEFIKDKIAALNADTEIEHFIAGLLRAQGLKTMVSPRGRDRGLDILATPDALGLEDPRIVVEVKHRKGKIGAPDIRSFIGAHGNHAGNRGLYISSGGFSPDAKYEAERASFPIRLMELDDLVEMVVAYYDHLDVETRQMVPLKRVFWPID